MLYKEIIHVCSQIHTNTVVMPERRIANVKMAVYSLNLRLQTLMHWGKICPLLKTIMKPTDT